MATRFSGRSYLPLLLVSRLFPMFCLSEQFGDGAGAHRRYVREGEMGVGTIDNVAYDAPVIRTPYSEMSKAYRYIVMNSQVYSL